MDNYKSQESEFDIQPIGIKYICEHCQDGEMIYDGNSANAIRISEIDPMFVHVCSECKNVLLLPKVYPYIKWKNAEGVIIKE